MARRNPEATASESAPVESNEAVPTDTPSTEAPAAEAKPEVPVDISSFTAVVDSILPEADTTTGDLSVEALAKTTEAYRALDGQKNKNAARDSIETAMREALMNDNGPLGKSYVLIRKSLSAGTTKAPAKPTDPTEAFVSKIATLVAAQSVASAKVPEGVGENWVEQVNDLVPQLVEQANQLIALEDGVDVPESITADAKKVAKLAAGRTVASSGGPSYSGPRRSTEKHILSAFADLQSGDFLTVNEIANKKSEEYGDDKPSSGAISARLFNSPTAIEGIVAVKAEEHPDGKSRGARKA